MNSREDYVLRYMTQAEIARRNAQNTGKFDANLAAAGFAKKRSDS